jgi:hypothetical protein
MKEREFENILERYPELIEGGLTFEGRQVAIGRRHIDLLFRDRFGQRLIVELKRGTIRWFEEPEGDGGPAPGIAGSDDPGQRYQPSLESNQEKCSSAISGKVCS